MVNDMGPRPNWRWEIHKKIQVVVGPNIELGKTKSSNSEVKTPEPRRHPTLNHRSATSAEGFSVQRSVAELIFHLSEGHYAAAHHCFLHRFVSVFISYFCLFYFKHKFSPFFFFSFFNFCFLKQRSQNLKYLEIGFRMLDEKFAIKNLKLIICLFVSKINSGVFQYKKF